METWRDIMILIGPHFMIHHVTGKFLSEALFFALSNPQYDDRLYIELPVQYMKITSSEHDVYINCSECQNRFLYTTCSLHVLSLEFSHIELVIK